MRKEGGTVLLLLKSVSSVVNAVVGAAISAHYEGEK